MSCYILSRHEDFHQCGSICGFSNYPPGRMSWHIISRHWAFLMRQNMASLQCGSIDVFFKVPYCMNVLSHFEQTCGFLTVRISSCVFKYAFCVNVFSHFEQACGFSPVWITSYFFQMCLPLRCLDTFWAGMWLYTCVDQFMSFQTAPLRESLWAFWAGIRLFISIHVF